MLGCVIGDFGAILWFQTYSPNTSALIIMSVAIVCGVLTSIALETVILSKQMLWELAFKIAIGMSLVSMILWWVIPSMLIVGFLVPWPYNYCHLKKLGKPCCS